MDESGDLGFRAIGSSSTRYFIMTFLCVDSKTPFERIVKDIHRMLKEKFKVRNGVLHAAREEETTIRRALLKLIQVVDFNIRFAYLDKAKVNKSLSPQKHSLYNSMTKSLLSESLGQQIDSTSKVTLVASQRETSKYLNDVFKRDVEACNQENGQNSCEVSIRRPQDEKALQLVDIVSWAIMRKFEYHDDSFYNIIAPFIVGKHEFFP